MDACVRATTAYKGNWPSFSRRVGNTILGLLLSKRKMAAGSLLILVPHPDRCTPLALPTRRRPARSIPPLARGMLFTSFFQRFRALDESVTDLNLTLAQPWLMSAFLGPDCEDYPEMTFPISTHTHDS